MPVKLINFGLRSIKSTLRSIKFSVESRIYVTVNDRNCTFRSKNCNARTNKQQILYTNLRVNQLLHSIWCTYPVIICKAFWNSCWTKGSGWVQGPSAIRGLKVFISYRSKNLDWIHCIQWWNKEQNGMLCFKWENKNRTNNQLTKVRIAVKTPTPLIM